MVEKYVLCRPEGGLNDALCQVELCWRYAEKFGRTLIVDTKRSTFRCDFAYFFDPREASDRVIFSLSEELLRTLNGASCYPPDVEGNLGPYDDVSMYEDEPTVAKSFDMSRDYPQQVLVHGMWGGGKTSFQLLTRLKFSPTMNRIITERLASLEPDYSAIHVRNTDYKTDFVPFFEKVAKKLGSERILICSDDAAVIETARSFFGKARVFTVSELPLTDGRPLHDIHTFESSEEMTQTAVSSMIDLVALGSARRLFITSTAEGGLSGFSILAAHLCDNRPLIGSLLDRETGPAAGGGATRILPARYWVRKVLPKPLRKKLLQGGR